MVDPDSNILKLRSEVLERMNASDLTYGREGDEDEEVKGRGVGRLRRIRPASTFFVGRQPGERGWRSLKIGPTSNGSNVRGTSTPRSLSPNGQPAENNKWKQPVRI